jgi:hypothetical protein
MEEGGTMQHQLDLLYRRLKVPDVDATDGDGLFERLKGPDLLWVSPAFRDATPRVAIIGQQQEGWEYTYREFIDRWTIEEAVSVYRQFNFGERYTSSYFWQFFKEVREHFFGEASERGVVAWLNLVKFVTTAPSQSVLGQSFERNALAIQNGIFKGELEILKPDICIFVTGWTNYDKIIRKYYPGVRFEDIGLGEQVLARLVDENLPTHSFRTYHPKHLRLRGLWAPVVRKIFDSVEPTRIGETS